MGVSQRSEFEGDMGGVLCERDMRGFVRIKVVWL